MKRLEYRCPWCGELLMDSSKKSERKFYFKQFDQFAIKCKHCDNMATRKPTIFPVILLFIGIITLNVCFRPEIAWIPFLLMIYCVVFRIAYEKKSVGRWDEHLPKEILVGTGLVHWYSSKEDGIGLPRLRIPNYFIFPICFVDSNNQPLSPMICMRFTKKEWWKFNCRYDIDIIIESNLRYIKNNFQKFYFYSGKRAIGEGNIKIEK